MSSVEEPDYIEVFEDLKDYYENGLWSDPPKWALDWAREMGVFVGHPSIPYRGWQFVAEKAMGKLHAAKARADDTLKIVTPVEGR